MTGSENKTTFSVPEGLLDENGKIVPTALAFDEVEKEYPDKSDAEKFRLAQAGTLLAWYESQKQQKQ